MSGSFELSSEIRLIRGSAAGIRKAAICSSTVFTVGLEAAGGFAAASRQASATSAIVSVTLAPSLLFPVRLLFEIEKLLEFLDV
jgi:hypothetical protein